MKNKKIVMAVMLVLLMLLPYVLQPFDLHIVNLIMINIILATGLNLVAGYVGELPLCQAAFYGLGAYSSALISTRLGLSFWPSLLFCLVFCVLVGLIFGVILGRVSAHVFVLMSLAFANIVQLLVLKLVSFTGGPAGVLGMPFPEIKIPNLIDISLYDEFSYYYLLLACVLLVLFLVNRIVNSLLGQTFKSIRENADVASSIGVNIYKYKIIAITVMSVISGLAGCLYAHYFGLISPTMLTFNYTLMPLVMIAVGGYGNLYGPIIGAVFITALPEWLRMISPVTSQYRLVLMGLILILCVFFLPNGIWGLVGRVPKIFTKRRIADGRSTGM